jgi:hypothetical protein
MIRAPETLLETGETGHDAGAALFAAGCLKHCEEAPPIRAAPRFG